VRTPIRVLCLLLACSGLTAAARSQAPAGAISAGARQGVTSATDTAVRAGSRRPALGDRPGELKERRPATEGLADREPEALDASEARVKFRVRSVRFEGNTVFSRASLARAARPYENRAVTLAELRRLCLRIRNAYRARGYVLARVGIPPQRIRGGQLRIAVSEGRYGKIRIAGNEHYSDAFIRRYFGVAEDEGIVRQRAVERALLLLNEFTDLSVRSVFDVGAKPGTTDVVLKVKDSFPFHVGFDYNNFGNVLVGRNRAGLALWIGNVITYGDEVFGHVTAPFPSDSKPFYQVGYTLPVGGEGARIAASFSSTKTAVGGDFEILDIRGNAEIASLVASHPLERTPRTASNVAAGVVLKDVANFIFENQLISEDRLREVIVSYDRNFLRGAGRTILSALYTQGLGGALEGTVNGDPFSSRPGAQAGNTFAKINADVSHLQQLDADTHLLLRLAGQATTEALTVPEQFALGGPDSVRGFVQSEFLGDQGYTTSAELRRTLYAGEVVRIQGVTFVDHGAASIETPLVGELGNRTLTGAGVGLRASVNNKVSTRLDVGFPVGGKLSTNDSSVLYGQLQSRF
jgi:hemolysin activation/secretion protein